MNLIETSVVTTLGAIAGGVVAWFTKGRFESESLQVKQAQAVLAMWQETAEAQKKELTELRNEIVSLRERIELLENTIQTLEAENATLKSQR